MFHLKQVLSSGFLSQLAESTAQGIARRDCFYDQLHYVNRRFVGEHFEHLAALVANAVGKLHPGITTRDLTYVNDFVAPINLANGQVAHTEAKDNKLDWHHDAIDMAMRPCYNLWIPLYRRAALTGLDDQSVFDVLTPISCPQLYDTEGNPKCNFLWNAKPLVPYDREILAQLVGVPVANLHNYKFFNTGGKTEKISVAELTPLSVVRPALGDCYVFNSSCVHASGPSGFERVGISIKFLVNNPKLGFRALPLFALPHGWWGMFICWYYQYGDFGKYQEVLDTFIMREQPLLEQNADKLKCVRDVLQQVSDELGAQ
jgi:hypothetical protein